MAITINGTGTISGISAGGLPDGCVTADDIASISASVLPSDSILQIVEARYDSQQTSTSTFYTYVATGHTGSITTTKDNSKIFVIINGQGWQSSGNGTNIGLQRKIGTGSYTRLLGTDGSSGDAWLGIGNGYHGGISWTINRQYLDDPQQVAGTALTYNPMLGLWNEGSATYGGSSYSAQCAMYLIEVAA